MLGAIGFPHNAAPGAIDPEVVKTLGLVYVPLVQALYVLAGLFLWSYKIDRSTHEENLRKLAASREG